MKNTGLKLAKIPSQQQQLTSPPPPISAMLVTCLSILHFKKNLNLIISCIHFHIVVTTIPQRLHYNMTYQELQKPSKCLQTTCLPNINFMRLNYSYGMNKEEWLPKFKTLLSGNSSHELCQSLHFSNLRVRTRGHRVYAGCCKCVAVVKFSPAAWGWKNKNPVKNGF